MNEYMPYDKPLWEMYLLENYSENESIVFVRMHHSFTDGVGYVSLMSCINDEKYKIKMDKKFPEAGLVERVLLAIATPFYIAILLITFTGIRTDKNAAKVRKLRGKDDFKNKFYLSEQIPFKDTRKCYKRFKNTTFNDYILGMLSHSLSQWYEEHGITDPDKILTVIPVNMRTLPNNIDELQLDNNVTAVKFEMPIRKELEVGIKDGRAAIKKFLNMFYIFTVGFFCKALPYMPIFGSKFFLFYFYKGVDMLFSNVPFSKEPWNFCNKEVKELGVFANLQHEWKFNFVVITYKNMVRFTVMAKQQLKMDPQKLLNSMVRNIKNDIQQHAKKA